MTVKKIMIIGCGGVGSRHLQALCKIDTPVELFAIDPNEKSLLNAQKLSKEVEINNNIKSIKFLEKIPEYIKKIDLCIISTSSNVRLKVLEDLIINISVKNIILEKVLFQSIKELDIAKNMIDEKKINCWVNCFRREENFWKEMKKIFSKNTNMNLYYGKSDWDMCCNSIHIIDLTLLLFHDKIKHIENFNLDDIIYESKRPGFIELTGILTGELKNGGTFKLESIKNTTQNKPKFEIISDTRKLNVDEDEGKAILCRKENEWIEEKYEFHIPFQSEKTQKIVKKILETEQCNLTTLNESVEMHKPLLTSFINHLNKISNSKYTYCPIT